MPSLETLYTTKQGDVLDALVWQVYGSLAPLQTVLEANTGLASEAQPFEAGRVIRFPAVSVATPALADESNRLWA